MSILFEAEFPENGQQEQRLANPLCAHQKASTPTNRTRGEPKDVLSSIRHFMSTLE